jgi:outer membrane receptor protein involved in Fe transport
VLKAGLTVRRMNARFDYDGSSTIDFAVQNLGQPPQHLARSVHLRTTSTELAAYVADRIRLRERLVVELGTRFESESHTPDGAHVSPRVNVSWFASDRTIVRAAWGRFYQPRSVYELPVEDGVTEFEPAQLAEHRIVGIEQVLGAGVTARLEAYDKSFSNLRPRYENLFDRLVVFPELRSDRIRIDATSASARGVELLLRRDTGGPWSGWLSYARSLVEDEIAGRDVPRSWDQRDTINFSANYRRGVRWNFNVAGTFHTGWPTTPIVAHVVNGRVVSELGPLNSDRFPTYKRVDLRASRSSGHLTLFVELFNVLNLTNTQRVNAFDFNVQPSGDVRTVAITEAVFGVVPSFGVAWRF